MKQKYIELVKLLIIEYNLLEKIKLKKACI